MLNYFKNFTNEELIKFEKFINSPYFNSNRNTIKLFNYLKEQKSLSENDLTNKEKIFSSVYNNINYDDAKYRKLSSDFSILFEKYLMNSEFENLTPGNRIMALTALRKRGLSKRFEMNIKELFEFQKKEFSKDDEYYLNQSKLEGEFYNFHFKRFQKERADCLQTKSDNIDFYFVFSKLHNFNEMINNEINTGIKSVYNKNYYDEVLLFVEKNRKLIYRKHPNLFIIYNVLQMFVTSDKQYLTELTKYLRVNAGKFPKSKLSHYYNYIISFYTIQINKGNTENRTELFRIFEYMVKKNLFVIDNIITEQDYFTVLNNSLGTGEYEWLNNFIETYKKKLDPEIANEAYNLAKAKLCFYKKDFENIFVYLSEVKYTDPGYYINSKVLLAKVYFDMGKIESLEYVLENLRKFIRNNKILNEDQISVVKIFNKYLFTLLKLLENIDVKKRKFALLLLKKEIDKNKKLVPHKSWFYEKIKELSLNHFPSNTNPA